MKVRDLIPLFLVSLIVLPLSIGGGTGTVLVKPPWNHCLGLNRVTQFHLDIFSGYRETFDDPQGLFCVKMACEDDPETTKDDDELTVIGLNSGRNTVIFNKSITSIGILGSYGSEMFKFNHPQSITGERLGNIYVADTGNDRIVHLRYENDGLIPVREFRGPVNDRLRSPSGTSFSGGVLYVADTANDRITRFDPEGGLLGVINPELGGAKLKGPYSIAAVTDNDEWLYYSDYFLAVVDSLGQRLWKISPDGEGIRIFRYRETAGNGCFNHIAIDYYGNVYVTDTPRGVIHKFDRHLNYIVAIGEEGNGPGQFDEPRGISIYRRFGQVFISERSGASYFWIGTDLYRFSADNLVFDLEKGTCRLDVNFLLAEHSTITMILEDERGTERLVLIDDYLLPANNYRRRLEITCDRAAGLAKCKLRVTATARPTYSSRDYCNVTRSSGLLEAHVISKTASMVK